MISPEARERLASLMDDRRLELGLRWRDVAKAGGVSYEALRDVRNGTGGIRRLTEHAIETGLYWEPGSVRRILEGGKPVTTDLRIVTTPRRLPKASPELAEAMRGRVEQIKALVAAARLRYPGEQLSGAQIFPRSESAASWHWDRLQSDGWAPEDMPGGVAAQLILEEDETAHESGSATG